jgi:ABC-type lipoprotein export system ATPase subunit
VSSLTPNQRAMVRTEKLGFVFQSFNLLARTTALQNVVMPLDYSLRRCPAQEASHLAQDLLLRVGLAERMHHVPSQMSGGQQQRVAIGRALVNHPALLLADEPTGNLDSHTSIEILKMFQQLHADGITVVLVTHDPNVAAYADRVIRIADGVIEGDERNRPPGSAQEVTAVNVADLPPPEQDATVHAAAAIAPRRHIAALQLPATWRTALAAMRRNKMRSGLSALGVIIAVAAVSVGRPRDTNELLPLEIHRTSQLDAFGRTGETKIRGAVEDRDRIAGLKPHLRPVDGHWTGQPLGGGRAKPTHV